MPAYRGESGYAHDSQDRLGVLIVNLGTPDSPRPREVRRFLAEFLGDPRVVEAPRWLWRLALHGFILRVRPARSAEAYRQIWTEAGSPLLLHSRALTSKLQEQLASRDVAVALGMTYGSPSIASALRELQARSVRRLLILPLYPQYSATTTAAAIDRVNDELRSWRWLPELRIVTSYADEPAYIDGLTRTIEAHWQKTAPSHLLFSFHGVPKRYLLAGDPYHCQCHKTSRLVAERLGLSTRDWSVSFQSQVGREEWLKPYTDELLLEYARHGPKRVTVVCPGFATDCLETLEEIAIRNRSAFLANGGEAFEYVPALNASDFQVELMLQIIERHTAGWHAPVGETERAARRERALALGAAR